MWKRFQFAEASCPKHPVEQVIEGACDCGDITIKLRGVSYEDRKPTGHICYCVRCRQVSGSHYVHNFEVPVSKAAIEGIAESNLTMFVEPNLMDNTLNYRWHCSRCGSPIAGKDGDSSLLFLRQGLFDTDAPQPAEEYIAWQKVDFLKDKICGLAEGPNMEEWYLHETLKRHPELASVTDRSKSVDKASK